MKPKVTVGTCAKNCQDFIKDAIDSIISQDFPHNFMEVVFVDDGSKDETLSMIKKHAQKMDMQVKIFHQKWKGLGFARNVIVDNASGDYIIWIDSDMVIPRDYIRKQVEFMEQHPEAGIAKGKQALEPGGNLLATLENYSRAASRMVNYNSEKAHSKSLGTGGSIYRVKAVKQVGGFDENIRGYGEDWDAEHRIRKLGWLLFTLELPFRDYERRKITWKALWRRYFQRGYDLHQFSLKKKSMIKFYKMLPPVTFLAGLFNSFKIYRLTRQKVAFLIPFQYAIKTTAWCFGYLRSYFDSRKNSVSKSQ